MRSTIIDKSPENVTTSLKVKTISLIVLQLRSCDLSEIDQQLHDKVKQGPEFFRSAPLLLDFANINEEVDLNWLKEINNTIEEHNFIPVGITGAISSLEDIARAEGIAIWPTGKEYPDTTRPQNSSDTKQENTDNRVLPQSHTTTKIVQQPVRSGQRVYAEGGDLIVMSSVNTGAEVMADGNIHVYGCLRGRALAGVKGWEDAKIFCQDLQPDLVAIAGYYTINDDIPEDRRSKAVRISLRHEKLLIDPLV
ncbi:MAG: septum site-determining protein MinC [Proteobacteria bacterium]|nr:septum site-determining protein MinC [Pseudomonadota bacterium]